LPRTAERVARPGHQLVVNRCAGQSRWWLSPDDMADDDDPGIAQRRWRGRAKSVDYNAHDLGEFGKMICAHYVYNILDDVMTRHGLAAEG
jgi:hypothetical protein